MFNRTNLGIFEKRKVSKKDAPTLFAIEIKNQIYAWCPFCKVFHLHGPNSINTHRVAHCTSKKSPFMENGYNIVVFNK
ncbi:MAG: hypothetical protein FWF00_05920 [Endomicrobia bacterium]|nr:hypothetical protein [Endomicrobiia bacterium]MCL2507203.1 hypothetical protein [Endomicrobiia bacterium]